MLRRMDIPPISVQIKALRGNKNIKCLCRYLVYLNGVVSRVSNEECKAHKTLWQKIKLYLTRKE